MTHNERGTGAGAVRAGLDAWLRSQSGARPRDWHRLMAEIHAALTQLCRHPLVVEDRSAQAIILEMVKAKDMEEIDFQTDLLCLRLRRAMLEKAGRESHGEVVLMPRQPSRPAALPHVADEGDVRARRILRL